MAKLWEGRMHSNTNALADMFNSSIEVDKRMYKEDIQASLAHCAMLKKTGIISEQDGLQIEEGLNKILNDMTSGVLVPDNSYEDIHSFVELQLTKDIGEAGKKLHTARSRNDQVAVDFKMHVKNEASEIMQLLKDLLFVLLEKAEQHHDWVMPGYTHLQRAQPITLGHHLMAYVMMLLRDMNKYADVIKNADSCPLGSAALAGTTFAIDRHMTAELLDFFHPSLNSLDGVADRDFALDIAYVNSLVMMHASRLCEEIVLWASWEFKFAEISDAFSTGSSIMPQKKNPDMAELVRGKSGGVFSALNSLLIMLKSLPLAYNKDMQEDKATVFASIDTTKISIEILSGMLYEMTFNKENMKMAASKGFINATDCADYLVNKGLPFRDAYAISGRIVAHCIQKNCILEDLSLEEYKSFSPLIDNDIYYFIDLDNCVRRRVSYGGTSFESVLYQIDYVKNILNQED